MRVLLSAYSCSPSGGSEPAIGWGWSKCIAAMGHEVVVATRAINRREIEAYCARESITNPQFLFHDLPPLIQKLYKVPFGNYMYYTLWQYTVAKKAARLHGEQRFDIAQHITWGSFRLPSFMGRLGIPFIFGPVAGGEDTPALLRNGLGTRGRLWDWMRRTSNSLLTLNPWVKVTYQQASQIVVTTKETLEAIPKEYRSKAKVQQAVAISEANFPAEPKGTIQAATAGGTQTRNDDQKNWAPEKNKLNLLYVGRLLPWKGVHLGLRALAKLRGRAADVHLTIIGSGSDEKRLKHLAEKLGLGERVTWIRWMPREQLLERYREFDLFLFPSLHDSGGMAALEAMWLGLPVVCLDLGGPGVLVDNTAGKVIATAGRVEAEIAGSIAGFLTEILQDPAGLTRLSEGARIRAGALTWKANVRNVYEEDLAPQAMERRKFAS
jgi:glycosyltransferase involved in cell wall biosynthesis